MSQAHIVYIADVFCPWCYGFAPIMKKLATENPDLPVHVLGGNLISTPMTLREDVAAQPGLTDFWRQVEQTTHRPLTGAIQAAETGADVRLYSPGADEILAALKKLSPGHELDQLIELEDLFYGQGRDLFTEESVDMIAKRWNLPIGSFEKALDQQATYEATERNLREAEELMGEIDSYPSVLLIRDNQIDAVSRGYVHYETVAARLKAARADLGLEKHDSGMKSQHLGCTLYGCRVNN